MPAISLLLDLMRRRLDPVDAAGSGESFRGDGDLNGLPSPSGRKLRHAAILAPLILHDGPPRLLFTERASHLPRHPGQISFPGGSLDPGDAGPAAAALREVEEEIGIGAEHVELVGRFESYETGTGFHITPFVGVLRPGYRLKPDPGEVAGVFEAPFDFLMDPLNHQRDSRIWQGQERHFYAMPWQDRYIWGVTAGLLKSLHAKLYGLVMLRITLIEIASFLLPFLIFFIWRWQANADTPIKPTPTLRLAAIGAGLSVLVMIALVLLESGRGGHEGDLYVPSRVVDGRVVPGYFIPAEEAQSADSEPDDASEPQ